MEEATIIETIDILCDVVNKQGREVKVRYEIITDNEPPPSTHNSNLDEKIKSDLTGEITWKLSQQ